MYAGKLPHRRYRVTLTFLKEHIPRNTTVLDLGVANPFSEIMCSAGYKVSNTNGEDLDTDTSTISKSQAEVVTAFEILEHLVSPYSVLKSIRANILVASVPLRLWFASAYKSNTNERDRHFHEFEDWQFDWLLQKSGWEIRARKKWTHPTNKIGIRPILRWFTPRYYMVYAQRK